MTDIIKKTGGNTAAVLINRTIGNGPGEISATQFKQELAGVNPDAELNIYHDSNGGGVEYGRQIYDAIRAHPGRTTSHIQGLCASIASVIAMAADEIFMSADALLMVHNPHWSVSRSESRCSTGNQKMIAIPRQFNKQQLITIPSPAQTARGKIALMKQSVNKHRNTSAERRRLLETDKEFILNAYFLRTGSSRAELASMMQSETWFTSWDCIQFGFADEITSPSDLISHWEFTQFANPTNFLAGRYMQSATTARAKRLSKVNRKQVSHMQQRAQKILNNRQQTEA